MKGKIITGPQTDHYPPIGYEADFKIWFLPSYKKSNDTWSLHNVAFFNEFNVQPPKKFVEDESAQVTVIQHEYNTADFIDYYNEVYKKVSDNRHIFKYRR